MRGGDEAAQLVPVEAGGGEIASLREQAEARMHSLQADIAAISDERRTLLEDVRRIAARLAEVVAEAEPAAEEMQPERRGTPEPGRAVTRCRPLGPTVARLRTTGRRADPRGLNRRPA